MRRIVLIALALVLVAGALLVRWRGGSAAPPSATPTAHDPVAEPGLAQPLREAPRTTPSEPADERTEVALDAAQPAASEPAACVVTGRVLDEEGAPLADVRVRLQAYQVWAEGVDVPRLAGRLDMRGFEVRTDAAGSFRITAPPPTAARTSLEIEPDRYHDSHVVRFDSDADRSQPALTAGVRDLDEIRLATTGAVRGRVTAEDGRPLADVAMDTGPGRSLTYSRGARTGADGTYLIEHAPVGTYAVKAKVEGFLSGYLEPVTVAARRDTTGIDFVLVAAPSIEGIVVDERGRPLAGARLYGWPSSSGSGAGATSGADGRFVVYLPQDEPYTMSAKLDGYTKWGDEHARSQTYAPGTRDLEVVMESLPSTRFAVVDADSGQPIERFGLNILEDNGSRATAMTFTERRRPSERDRPGGIAEATARQGIDLYVIAAEGFLLASGDVEHDAPDEPLQTVRMQRGASVRGRVLRDGQAVASARVEIVAGSFASRNEDGEGVFRARDNTARFAQSDAAGRFELTALEAGLHRLTVHPPERGAPLLLVPLKVEHRAVQDLGDLALLPGAAIAGHVLLPPGVEPAGLCVFLDETNGPARALVDGQGRFRFEDLAPGPHTLTLDDRPGVLASSKAVEVELTSGETLPVTLDARDRAMCAVALEIVFADLPVAGMQVNLVASTQPPELATLGHCDASGLVTGSVRAWGEAKVSVYLPTGDRLEHPEARLQLVSRGSVEQTVRFELARLRLLLPGGVALPEDGTARLQLTPVDAGRATQFVHVSFVGGAVKQTAAGVATAGSGELVCACLAPGPIELTLELSHASARMERIELPGGGFRVQKPSYYSVTRQVLLVANEELALQLE